MGGIRNVFYRSVVVHAQHYYKIPMTELKLSKEEKELVIENISHLKVYALETIKKGLLIFVSSLLLAILFWSFGNNSDISNKLIAAALFFSVYGIYMTLWWTKTWADKKLQTDLEVGKKIVDEAIIKHHSKPFRRVKLANGFKLEDFLIEGDWSTGDRISYEYTPTAKLILRTKITHHNNT